MKKDFSSLKIRSNLKNSRKKLCSKSCMDLKMINIDSFSISSIMRAVNDNNQSYYDHNSSRCIDKNINYIKFLKYLQNDKMIRNDNGFINSSLSNRKKEKNVSCLTKFVGIENKKVRDFTSVNKKSIGIFEKKSKSSKLFSWLKNNEIGFSKNLKPKSEILINNYSTEFFDKAIRYPNKTPGQRYKLIQNGVISLCKSPHSRNVLSKILNMRILRRWKQHKLILADTEIFAISVCYSLFFCFEIY